LTVEKAGPWFTRAKSRITASSSATRHEEPRRTTRSTSSRCAGVACLCLNFVDAQDPAYIPKEIVDRAIAFIHEKLSTGKEVLVHCNQGESRGPAIAFLYLLRHTAVLLKTSLDAALEVFQRIYPAFHPGPGIAGYIAARWND
jgi:protein-tyrosine phosphatase